MAGEQKSTRGADLTPAAALQQLRDGNQRFLSGKAQHPRSSVGELRDAARQLQQPLAAVLSCSDSRLPLERIFDLGFGDIFAIRIAGNVCGIHELASLEYAALYLGTPLVLVVGHTGCAAVAAAAGGETLEGAIPQLLSAIAPAVAQVRAAWPELDQANLVLHSIEANIWQSVAGVLTGSPGIAERVRAGQAQVAGALFEMETGAVRFLGAHPQQTRLLDQ